MGSILGSLLFLIYIDDHHEVSNILDSIIFADDRNLFYSHQNINDLFSTVNSELECINRWFKANKLSLNIEKTKYTLFHKKSAKNEISEIPDLKIGNKNIFNKVFRSNVRRTYIIERSHKNCRK